MQAALRLAEKAFTLGEVPVGAVVVSTEGKGRIVGRGYNQRESLKDPTAHAEMLAITAAANTLQDWRLSSCVLYVTKEPCPMCAGAIVNSRLAGVVFGAYDPEKGCCGSLYQLPNDPRFHLNIFIRGGILEAPSRSLIQDFFRSRRNS
ncbi:MAG: nucleoside deaminase [Candidatus Neomarinimicrobiota bacterium]|nr:MAG: nucleoside deaminase [Candidatus Neomarinimicrobiota bacterium]